MLATNLQIFFYRFSKHFEKAMLSEHRMGCLYTQKFFLLLNIQLVEIRPFLFKFFTGFLLFFVCGLAFSIKFVIVSFALGKEFFFLRIAQTPVIPAESARIFTCIVISGTWDIGMPVVARTGRHSVHAAMVPMMARSVKIIIVIPAATGNFGSAAIGTVILSAIRALAVITRSSFRSRSFRSVLRGFMAVLGPSVAGCGKNRQWQYNQRYGCH